MIFDRLLALVPIHWIFYPKYCSFVPGPQCQSQYFLIWKYYQIPHKISSRATRPLQFG
jgi:hypothetical protein